MNNLPSVPNVEVIENGRPVSQNRIDPSVASFIAQMAMTAQLVRIRKLAESAIPTGVKPLKRTVTDTVMTIPLYPPWISFSLINDGAGALTVWVNDRQDPQQEGMVSSAQTYNCDMTYPIIRALYLKAASGTTASVRIYGKEGKGG